MVLKIFFYGMISAVFAIFIELGFLKEIPKLNLFPSFIIILDTFFGVALVEETLKYLVVRKKVLNNPELDEPLDVMLYMIISALGFVTLENFLIFLSPETFFSSFRENLLLAGFRFVSATFLHALASGTLGFFLALSFFETRKRGLFLCIGFFSAVFLHGLYNFAIINMTGYLKFAIPTTIIVVLSIFVSSGFKRLKKLKSICKI